MKKKKILSPGNVLWGIAVAGLVALAINDQLQRPPEQRTWHGSVMGLPYDFRFPTLERLRATFWNKDTSSLLMPHAFGIGWTINFYPLLYPKRLESVQ